VCAFPAGLSCVAAFGGLSKFEQFKELKAGAEIAVATPGRMMDLLRMKACSATRVTYLVLDEADRMFDMGFGEQVRQCAVLWYAVLSLDVCVHA
jgi:ATP-dependent RNA helicase DDX42